MYDIALNDYLKVFDFFNKQKIINHQFKAHVDLIEFYRKISKYDLAQNLVYKTNQFIKTKIISDTIQLIRYYGRIAAVKNEISQIDSSIYYTNKALQIAQLHNNKYAIATAYNELGFSYKNKHLPVKAEWYYKQAQNIWFSINANREGLNALYNELELLSHLDRTKNERIENIKNFQIILKKLRPNKINIEFSKIYSNISQDYHFMGDTLNKLRYQIQTLKEKAKELRVENEIKVQGVIQKYENEKIKTELNQVTTNLQKNQNILITEQKSKKLISLFLLLSIVFIGIVIYFLLKQKKSNTLLNKQNEEKDILIQEVHHRVKNNLQFVGGLLEMHHNTNPKDKLLNDASRRINAMALAHEMLYNEGFEQSLDFKKYIIELCSYHLNDAFKINHQLTIEEIIVSPSQCISVGMIISELITNSIKHAFKKNTTDALICIEIKTLKTNDILLSYKDNGVGLSNHASKNLGSRLIDIFSRQLHGNYKIDGTNGYEFNLIFKLK